MPASFVGRIVGCVSVIGSDIVPKRTPGFGYVEHDGNKTEIRRRRKLNRKRMISGRGHSRLQATEDETNTWKKLVVVIAVGFVRDG
jgi:hypothetical protein